MKERDDGWKEAPAEIKGTYLDNFKNVWDLYINNSKYDKKTLATGGYDAEAEFKRAKQYSTRMVHGNMML